MAKDQWEVVSKTPIQSSKSPWEVVSVAPIGEEDRKKKEEEERKKQGIASVLPEDPFKPTKLTRDTRYETGGDRGYDYKKGEIAPTINNTFYTPEGVLITRDPKQSNQEWADLQKARKAQPISTYAGIGDLITPRYPLPEPVATVPPPAPPPAQPIAQPTAQPVAPQALAPTKPTDELAPLEEASKGLKGMVMTGFPIMGEQLKLSGGAESLDMTAKKLSLMNKIDSGEVTDVRQLRSQPGFSPEVGMYFASKQEVRDRLKGSVSKGLVENKQFIMASMAALENYKKEAEQYRGRTDEFTDIRMDANVAKDFTNWLANKAGSGAAQLGPLMLAAATGGTPAILAMGTGMGFSEAVGNRMQAMEEKLKGLPPEQQAQAIAKYLNETDDVSMAVAIASGSMDAFFGTAAGLVKNIAKSAAQNQTKKQAMKEAAKDLPKQMKEEFLTGGAQEATQISGEKVLGEQKDVLTGKNLKRIINAATAEAAGVVGGAPVNIGLAGLRAPGAPAPEIKEKIEPTLEMTQRPEKELLPKEPIVPLEEREKSISIQTAPSQTTPTETVPPVEVKAEEQLPQFKDQELDDLIAKYETPATTTTQVQSTAETPAVLPAEVPTAPPTLIAPPDFKLKKGRNEQVALAARQLADGKITKEEFDRYVDTYTPIATVGIDRMETPIEDAPMAEMLTTKLGKDNKDPTKVNAPIADGTPVGLRMDIPALEWGKANQQNGSVVSIHQASDPANKSSGQNMSYKSAGAITDATFAIRDENRAFGIAQNKEGREGQKTPQQTIEGKWVNMTPAQVMQKIQENFNNPEWTQVSMDPLRHSFFYSRATKEPVISADEVLQVGRFVLAKNVKTAPREQFLYSLEAPQTKTPFFQKWFGNSKVVDTDGKPLVMYHGTKGNITVFKTRNGLIFTTPSPEFANKYAEPSIYKDRINEFTGEEQTPSVMPIYVKAENPFDFENKEQLQRVVDQVRKDVPNWIHLDEIAIGNWKILESDAVINALKKLGFDGVYITEKGVKNLAVFEPTQIKSATGNVGTFDETNPDIRYNINDSILDYVEENQKRSPSLIREIKNLTNQRNEGRLTDEEYLARVNAAIEADGEVKNKKLMKSGDRTRGADFIRQKLLEAKRRGQLSEKAVDMAEWFILKNPALVEDLAIGIKTRSEFGVGGVYSALARLMILMKNGGSDNTIVHEILHHLERMMPKDMQDAIRKEWGKALLAAEKKAKTPSEKLFFALMMNTYFGSNKFGDVVVPPESKALYDKVSRYPVQPYGVNTSPMEVALDMLKTGEASMDLYQYTNPSEFWAVRASDIVAKRFDMKDSTVNRIRQWLRELVQKIKGFFGLRSDAPLIKALNSLANSDGTFQSKNLLSEGSKAFSIEKQTPEEVGQDVLEDLLEMGRVPPGPDPTLFQKARDAVVNNISNPRLTVESATEAARKFGNKFENAAFSSDAALNNDLGRAVKESAIDNAEMVGALLETSLSQTVWSDAVASTFINYGNIRYNEELHKWEAVDSDAKLLTISEQIGEIATKYGMTHEEAQYVAHTALEAKRTGSLSQFNQDLSNRANSIRAQGGVEVDGLRNTGQNDEADALEKKVEAAARKILRGRKIIHLTDEEIDIGNNFFRKIPELKKIVKTWNEMRENSAKVLVDSGLWSAEDADELLSNIDYVPFNRVMDENDDTGRQEVLRGLIVKAREPKLTGSLKPVNDIFDNMAKWTQYAIGRSVRNRSALALIDAAVENDMAEQVSTKDKGKNVVRVWREGKEEFYSMVDPMYMDAFRGLESVAIPALKWFSKPAEVVRSSIVMFPLFTLLQLPADSYAAMFTSGLRPRYALSIPARAVKEFALTLANMSNTNKELARFGSVGVKDFSSAAARKDIEIRAGLRGSPGIWNSVKNGLHHFAMSGDNAIRQATYEATMAQGKKDGKDPIQTRAEALEKSFEIWNVRRRGTSKSLALAAQVIPFYNAYLAAQNIAYKMVTGRGISPTERKNAYAVLAATTGSVMVLSLLYSIMLGDDPDYLKKQTVVRDRMLMIPGTGGLGIPLRSDWYTMPKILTEHLYLLITDKGYEDARKFRTSMLNSLANSLLSPTLIPQAVKAPIEVGINYDFFQGRPLVGEFEKKKEAERQFNESTSQLAKLLSKAPVNYNFERGQWEGLSPIAIDHLIRGMLGTMGGAVSYASNFMLSDPEVERPTISTREALATFPGASGVFTKDQEAGLKNDFYVLRDETAKAAATFSDVERRSPEKLKELINDEKFMAKYALSKDVEGIARELSQIRKDIAQVSNLPKDIMTREEKDKLIKKLREAESTVLKAINVKKLRKDAKL